MNVTEGDAHAIDEILVTRGRLDAVHELRQRTGCSLTDAVGYVDRVVSRQALDTPPGKPAEWWVYPLVLLVALALVAGIVFFAWQMWFFFDRLFLQ